MDEWDIKPTRWQRLCTWWHMWRTKQVCDSCEGAFSLGNMTPTSGDVWLCSTCMKELHDYMMERQGEMVRRFAKAEVAHD